MSSTTIAPWILALLCGGLVASNWLLWKRVESLTETAPPIASAGLRPLPAPPPIHASQASEATEPPPELAPFMGELERLTHKLHLSAAAGNHSLTAFYLYESREVASEIKTLVPEYRGHAIALFVERLLEPSYAALGSALEGAPTTSTLQDRVADVVAACNRCHQATAHPFIQIAQPPGHHPFLQRFAPVEHHAAQIAP